MAASAPQPQTAAAPALPAPPLSAAASADAGASDAQRWVAAFVEGWRAPRGPRELAAHFRPWLSPQVRLIQPQLPTAVGHEEFEEQFVRPLFALIPDVHGTVERWAANGELIYIELEMRGTLGGRPVSWRVCDRITLREGVAVERESYMDPAPLLAAIARTPRVWPRFLGLQLRRLARHTTRRRRS